MPHEKKTKPPKEAQDRGDALGDQERPTVTPPFDLAAFAQDALDADRTAPAAPELPTVPPPPEAGPRGRRAPMPTHTDPQELEEARQRSIAADPARRATPTSTLSLANAQAVVMPRDDVDEAFGAWESRIPSDDTPPSTLSAEELAARSASIREATAASAQGASAGAPPAEREMNDRVSVGDYSGALEVAERLLALEPANTAALACAESCRDVLRKMYVARIGPLDRVPIVMVPRDQLRWLSIDHRAGFVLSLVDGVSSVEMILDVSGMPELDALRILADLTQQRVVGYR